MSDLPSSNTIPCVLTDASVYLEGSILLGVATIEMPDVEYLTESLTGLGIAGELDTPVIGHVKSMSLKLSWNTCNQSAFELFTPKAHQLEIYASIQHYDAGSGEYKHLPMKVVVKAPPKKNGIGKMEAAKKMSPDTELELYYIKVWQDGKELLEIDKFNYIFRVNETDYLSAIRSNLGKD